MPEEAPHPVKTTRKSLQIVETLGAEGPMRLTDLATALEMGDSVVHNHLSTLKEAGYVTQDGDRYDLGLRFLELGGQTRKRRQLFQAAEREVQDLADETGELCNLLTEEDGVGVYLYRAKGNQAVDIDTFAGMRTPITTTALGKAILAFLPRSRVETIIEEHGLPAITEQTVTERDALFEDLDAIRERGYALDDGERIEGLRCVAAPVTDADKTAVGAISVSGPKNRIRKSRFREELPEQVTGVANVVELNLQFD